MSKTIAIDGPSGAGKSSIARQAAQAIGFIYVDTGALYRSIAYFVQDSNVDVSDVNAIASFLEKAEIELKFIDGEQRVFLNGDDVSDEIRTPGISMLASKISALSIVREFCLICKDRLHVRMMLSWMVGTSAQSYYLMLM